VDRRAKWKNREEIEVEKSVIALIGVSGVELSVERR
jgi:hypothetical protein